MDAGFGTSSEQESAEHRAIMNALDAVDAALRRQLQESSPAAMGGALMDAVAALDMHRAAAEDAHGILAEMDVTHGRCECMTAARSQHEALEREAQELSRMLAMSAAPDGARLQAFAQELRAHGELLGELRLASFNQDIGVVD